MLRVLKKIIIGVLYDSGALRWLKFTKNIFQHSVIIKQGVNFEEIIKKNLEGLSDFFELMELVGFDDSITPIFCVKKEHKVGLLKSLRKRGYRVERSKVEVAGGEIGGKDNTGFFAFKNFRSPEGTVCFSKREGVVFVFSNIQHSTVGTVFMGHFFRATKKASDEALFNFSGKKVDLVYTWVDDSDELWLEKKNAFLSKEHRNGEYNATAISSNRFKNRGELLFSIRSASMYANFIDRIYIVSDNQFPAWLDNLNDKISVISHDEIFPDKAALPCFNSHAIEACVVNIDGLSDFFIYMNDDIFFGRSVTLGKFFNPDAGNVFYSKSKFIPSGDAGPDDLPVDSAAKNFRKLMWECYKIDIARKFQHAPAALKKSTVEEVSSLIGEGVENTIRRKFRSHKDYSILTCAAHHYSLFFSGGVAKEMQYLYVDIGSIYDMKKMFFKLVVEDNEGYDVVCVNDVSRDITESSEKIFLDTMNKLYPFASPFENACDLYRD